MNENKVVSPNIIIPASNTAGTTLINRIPINSTQVITLLEKLTTGTNAVRN